MAFYAKAAQAAATPAVCRACGGCLEALFDGRVLNEIPVTYATCVDCHTLQLPSPHWLDRAYAQVLRPDPDTGRLMRAQIIHRVILRLRFLRLLKNPVRALDEGASLGLLVRLLRDAGIEAWGHDPYACAMLAEEFNRPTWPEGVFQLISAIEVIEHTQNPTEFVAGLARRLDRDGVLIITTELFDPKRISAVQTWPYLAPALGQHITFLSAAGLRAVAENAGLTWWASLEFAGSRCIHLLSPRPPSRWKIWQLGRRHARGESLLDTDRI